MCQIMLGRSWACELNADGIVYVYAYVYWKWPIWGYLTNRVSPSIPVYVGIPGQPSCRDLVVSLIGQPQNTCSAPEIYGLWYMSAPVVPFFPACGWRFEADHCCSWLERADMIACESILTNPNISTDKIQCPGLLHIDGSINRRFTSIFILT